MGRAMIEIPKTKVLRLTHEEIRKMDIKRPESERRGSIGQDWLTPIMLKRYPKYSIVAFVYDEAEQCFYIVMTKAKYKVKTKYVKSKENPFVQERVEELVMQ